MSPYADSQDPGGGTSVVNSSTENTIENVIVNGVNGIVIKSNSISPSVNNNNSNNIVSPINNNATSPTTATNAAGVVYNNNNSNNNTTNNNNNSNNSTSNVINGSNGINIMNSGNSITISGSGISIPSPSGNGSGNGNGMSSSSSGINYSAPLADIDQYLIAFPSDLPELVVAACWWAESLGRLNMNIPKDNIKRFRKELLLGLRNRVNGHWYPDYPDRGQGYRAIICEETTDRLLMDAAKKSDIVGDFRQLVKQNTTMWIDPGNVTYRHGKHYEKVLYPFNYCINQSTPSSSSSSSTSSSSNNSNNNNNNNNNNIYINNNNTILNIQNNNLNGSGTYQPTTYTPTRLNPNNVVNSNSHSSSLSNSNSTLNGNRISSPSLSSAAPVFSPSSMYQHIQQQSSSSPSISPPASPAKDIGISIINNNNNNTNVYSQNNFFYQNQSNNNSKIKLYSP